MFSFLYLKKYFDNQNIFQIVLTEIKTRYIVQINTLRLKIFEGQNIWHSKQFGSKYKNK